jgi:cysteine desulfurase
MSHEIYLDNNMATRPSAQTVSKMLPFLTDHWGSPSSPHQKGQELYPALSESYRSIYKMLGAKDSDNFVFTSSGAEAMNHVIQSAYYDITRQTGKNQYLTSNIDEAPPIMAIGRLEQLGCIGKMVEADKHGRVTAEIVGESITPRTAIISLSWANGLTGVINPVSDIAKLCHERGIALHLDATQVLGKLFFDLEEVGASFISFNGDQLHAPKGTGGLWIKHGIKCSPFILGGIEQAGLRAGSYNIPGLIALGHAAEELLDSRDLLCTEVARLRNAFEEGILQGFPEAQVFFNENERLPHCTAIGFPGIANEALLFALNRKGVYASIGGGSFQQIGLILEASGIEPSLAHSAISFSLSRETTEEQIEKAIEIVLDCTQRLRKNSQAIIPSKGLPA